MKGLRMMEWTHRLSRRVQSSSSPRLGILAFWLFLLFSSSVARAHELDENRATLVLRDGVHIAMTIYLSYPEVLHLAMAPASSMEEFLIATSSMPPEQFIAALHYTEGKFAAGIRVVSSDGEPLTISNWHWPDAAQAQAQLQHRVMQAIVAPGEHPAEEPLEIHADALANQQVQSVRVSFPPEFQKVLVVAYRPEQVWVVGKELSRDIAFH
jgi:hypothetical protein